MRNHFINPKKEAFQIGNIKQLQIIFDNGDYAPVFHTEIINYQFTYYDRLVSFHRGYAPRARSGEMRLKLKRTCGAIYDRYQLFDPTNYRKDRINAMIHRMVDYGGIRAIRFFNDDNWSYLVLGDYKAEFDGEDIVIKAYPSSVDEPYQSDNFNISIAPIKKDDILYIHLDFENCEYFEVYNEEITSFDVVFGSRLDATIGLFYREIVGGKMRLRITKTRENRKITLFTERVNRKIYPYELRERLAGKDGYDFVNLCRLYITTNHVGFGMPKEEDIEIMDVRPGDIIQEVDEAYENDEDYHGIFEWFIGGVAKDIGDKTVEITFGVFPDELRRKYENASKTR